jgi:hypothetical protein
MASRTHDFHDYSFGSTHSRPRQVWYRREDPVELPRTSIWRAGGGAIATAAAMGALVIGSAYAAFRETPAPLLEDTPALPPIATWQPDLTVSQAHVINVLQGPAMSVPEKAGTTVAAEAEEDVPPSSFEAPSSKARSFDSPPPESPSFASPPPESREVIIDDSKMYPPTSTPAPYPNPTTTPPDAVAPPVTNPAVTNPSPSAPPLDTENPYRDSEQP